MDERRFDDLVRNLGATGRSRRAVLKGLMAGALGGAVGLLTAGGAAAGKGNGNGNNGNGDNGNGNGNSKKPDCCPSTAPRLCGLQCVDVLSDVNNCGGCGFACPDGSTCQDGACLCPDGTTLCGNACVDTSSDNDHCGGCDTTCTDPQTCQDGECLCPAGTVLCGDTCVDTSTDASNCGSCGHPCSDLEICHEGSCVTPSECVPEATRSCYGGPDGTEGVGMCTAGTQTCQADGTWGECIGEVRPQTETCNGQDDDCDGRVDNGFDKQNDPNNCGTCGHVCFTPNAEPGCRDGQCIVAACHEGWGDCDDDPANGCEHDVSSDPANCGGCGIVCGPDEVCTNGSCHQPCPESTDCVTYTFDTNTETCSTSFALPGTVCGPNMACNGSGTCVTTS